MQSPSEQSPVELVRWGPKRRHLVRQRNEQIYAYYQEGWSQVEISREFGISQPLVSRILRRSAQQPKSEQHQRGLQAKLVGMTLRTAHQRKHDTKGAGLPFGSQRRCRRQLGERQSRDSWKSA